MQFKPPGGELTFWSALWVIFGIGACVVAATTGMTLYFLLGALVGLPALGMWFDQRWCGYFFTVVIALTLPLGIIAFFTLDDTLGERAYRLLRIAMSVYFAFISFQWAQDS